MKKNNLIKKFKQATAGLLTGAMLLTGAPLGSITSLAAPGVTGQTTPYATELENDEMLMRGRPNDGYDTANNHYYQGSTAIATNPVGAAASYGHGTSTAYKFGYLQNSTGNYPGWKFDLNGMLDDVTTEPTTEADEPYVRSVTNGGQSITYNGTMPSGFNLALNLGPGNFSLTDPDTIKLGEDSSPRSRTNSTASPYYPSYDGEFKNGEVVKVFYKNGSTYVDAKLEVRFSIKPTADGRYILTEFTAKNTNTNADNADTKLVDSGRRSSASGDGGRTVKFASATDIEVGSDDLAPFWTTPKTGSGDKPEGIHGQSEPNGYYAYGLSCLDVLTYSPLYPGLGIRKRNGSDPSKMTTWLGPWVYASSNYTTDTSDVSYLPVPGYAGTNPNTDTGMAFSVQFDLLPGEEKTATMAWVLRGPTYYVDPVDGDDTTGNGFMTKPYKTIQKAVDQIGSKTPKKTYVYIMRDTEVDSTVTIPANKSITFSTTDFVRDSGTYSKLSAYPIIVGSDGQRSNQLSIKRAAGFTGPLFKVKTSNTSVSFTDVIVDGCGDSVNDITSPLVLATDGTVNTLTGGVLKNNKITPVEHEQFTDLNANGTWDAGEPFIDANGNNTWDGPEAFTDANSNGQYDALEAFVDANNNGVRDKYANATVASAIDLSGSAKLIMNYGTIQGNTSFMGGAVTKNAGSEVQLFGQVNITGNTSESGTASNLMVDTSGSTAKVPKKLTSTSRIGLSSLQPIPASPPDGVTVVETPVTVALPYALANFTADKAPGQSTLYGSVNGTKVNLNAIEVSYTIRHELMDGSPIPSTTVSRVTTAGTHIAVSPLSTNSYIHTASYTDPDTGVTLTSPEITPTGSGLTVASNGDVSGYLPGNDVTIVYRYLKNASVAKFDSQGGTPATVPDIVSLVGGPPSASLPIVDKTGYDFVGWFKYTDANNNNTYDTGDTVLTTSPTGEAALDSPVVAGTVHYFAKWTPSATPYNFDVKHKNSSTTVPISFATSTTPHPYLAAITASPMAIPGYRLYTAVQSPMSPNYLDSSNNYNGQMSIGGAAVTYTYRVDPSVRKTFKVEHIDTTNGSVISSKQVYKTAEAAITASPITTLGYGCELPIV